MYAIPRMSLYTADVANLAVGSVALNVATLPVDGVNVTISFKNPPLFNPPNSTSLSLCGSQIAEALLRPDGKFPTAFTAIVEGMNSKI